VGGQRIRTTEEGREGDEERKREVGRKNGVLKYSAYE